MRGLLEGFPITPAGLPVFAVEESGEVINDHVCIYGVAFALFGLAHGAALDDDPEIAARAVIMSGAYEENWKKHPGFQNSYCAWQNKLPLYNLRMQNLSAAVIRPQLPEVARRVQDGRRNHDHVAAALNACGLLAVPPALPPELRAPDSIQFTLTGDWTDAQALRFQAEAKARCVSVQIFGLSEGNARAFWNWQFLGEAPELPLTRAMLMRACDVRLPARLALPELDFIAQALCEAARVAHPA